MRLDRVYIDGFKNLRGVEVDFDENRLTTVVIGENGAGKSNLLEAITDVFRFVDMNRGEPRYRYEIDYRIGSHNVRVSNLDGRPRIIADGQTLTRAAFVRRQTEIYPDLIFGYYSGMSRRLEKLFDGHQRQYYDRIKTNDDPIKCLEALTQRRLFYCRPIHGVMALLSCLALPDADVERLLRDKLGVVAFHSALLVFRQPWYAKGTRRTKMADAHELWGAEGPAGTCARRLRDVAFHPLALEDNPIDDYRDKRGSEAQFAAFVRNVTALKHFANIYHDDREMFVALETMDISDLIRHLLVWVTRVNDATGDVGFADLSDGERQLLMVLGLIRISRGKRALFLLDEPDTHLNPVWQLTYLDMVRDWTGVVADESKCQIVMTSHNPLTITALQKEEVRVMCTDKSGKITVSAPYTDPRGLGFTATLTEIFGLPTSLDPDTQRSIDERNALAHVATRTSEQDIRFLELSESLMKLGFMFEDREPLYHHFLRAWNDVRYADRPPFSPDQIADRHKAMIALIKEINRPSGVES